jgi:hypothetical protein
MRFVVGILILALAYGCVTWKPATIYSTDPSHAAQQRLEDQTNKSNVEAFIAAHPELDAETKRELRDGTITPAEALKRLEKKD